jgi:hypothetical protein
MPTSYKPILIRMMSFVDDEQYDDDKHFTLAELGELTPEKLMEWFNHVVFGSRHPPNGHDLPPLVRTNSIKYWKKALSSFMPNRLMVWNELSLVGNPTRSTKLNELIKYVKKKEARAQGVPSQARRSIKAAEYLRAIDILKEGGSATWKFGIPALMNFQFHLISRIDCATQVKIENLAPHDHFSFVLKTKLNWSKNVLEERDAPWQAVLASMDFKYCVHLSVALWLEVYIPSNPTANLTPYLFAFSNDSAVPRGGVKAKTTVQDAFKDGVFNRAEFAETGPLGSHSVRKFASSNCRNKGATKDEKDLRGRWKSKQRVSDVYDDVELPFPDAKVAGMLCMGGPCRYQVLEESGVTDVFILHYVTPHVRIRSGDATAIILGRALLWYAFSEPGATDIPLDILNRIREAYGAIATNNLPDGTNPVKKIPLVITGHEGEVYIDDIPDGILGNNGNGAGAGNNRAVAVGGGFIDRPVREQLLAIHSQLNGLRTADADLRTDIQNDRLTATRRYQTLNSGINRIALQPARRVAQNANNDANQPQQNNNVAPGNNGGVAALSPTPRCLYVLWAEYQDGIGGRKAARLFTSVERGQVKHKFTRRKVVWDAVERLVRGGLQANVAIDRIYQAYGRELTVTMIINRMLRDRRTRIVPALLR